MKDALRELADFLCYDVMPAVVVTVFMLAFWAAAIALVS
ncbi:hypothetical protein GGQ79_000924 [Ochrobactrum pecoris]|uniref:Uncharacterized protein n=1 Tax=Brucella pecoris TaxID=867683 RepID=A0AB34YMP7_9HYPH|nr:hypothetical protein [Brucella pecoris]